MSEDKEWQRICDSYADENQRLSDRIEKLEAAFSDVISVTTDSVALAIAVEALEGKDD